METGGVQTDLFGRIISYFNLELKQAVRPFNA